MVCYFYLILKTLFKLIIFIIIQIIRKKYVKSLQN